MKRYIFTGMAILAVVLTIVFVANRSSADENDYHGFYGSITYNDCDCTDGAYADRVYIKKLPSGTPKYVGVTCRQGVGSYDTEVSDDLVFAPGSYQLWVEFDDGGLSECETSSIEQVTHGYSKQQVNIIAYGPTGGGS